MKSRSFVHNISGKFYRIGSYAIVAKSTLYVNSKQISKFKTFFKKINKKSEKTKRFCWVNMFPYYPLSKKPQGLRMGKGSGKLNGWHSKIKSGSPIVQLKGIRLGRIRMYFNQLNFKLSKGASLINL